MTHLILHSSLSDWSQADVLMTEKYHGTFFLADTNKLLLLQSKTGAR